MLRLFVPSYDRERPAYGIKTATIGKLFIRTLAIDANGEIAKKLMQKDSSSGSKTGKSDYADMVYEIIKNRVDEQGTRTIYEVNHHLTNIAEFYQNNQRPSELNA